MQGKIKRETLGREIKGTKKETGREKTLRMIMKPAVKMIMNIKMTKSDKDDANDTKHVTDPDSNNGDTTT